MRSGGWRGGTPLGWEGGYPPPRGGVYGPGGGGGGSSRLAALPKPDDLAALLRPKAFYGPMVHEHCPRRAYFDEGKFARKLSDPGCLLELGCKGPVTHADCSLRL